MKQNIFGVKKITLSLALIIALMLAAGMLTGCGQTNNGDSSKDQVDQLHWLSYTIKVSSIGQLSNDVQIFIDYVADDKGYGQFNWTNFEDINKDLQESPIELKDAQGQTYNMSGYYAMNAEIGEEGINLTGKSEQFHIVFDAPYSNISEYTLCIEGQEFPADILPKR